MEKEVSRRGWPWKKKSNEKIAAAPESTGTSPKSTRLSDEQVVLQKWDFQQREELHAPSPKDLPKISQDHTRISDGVTNQWLHSDEKLKTLNEKLANALADITTKDNLVKQHAKVAEEAVTGWEKAEAEAVAIKQQLDSVLQQKLATEDRVAHLDGALKECMKQLRHVREEQEQRIHDALVKKTRDYDKLRADMEIKLAEASQLLAQTRADLLESRAETKALTHALQDRTRSVAEIGEAKGRAEADNKILQVRLEAIEKENSNFKYEVHVLNKELEIRNQEREYERKAADAAAKQHLDSVKKIAKLEDECNRLRLLVRKKLPGPAALQRMRLEVDGLGKDPGDTRRRRSLGRNASNIDAAAMDVMQENGHENGGTANPREVEMLAERIVAMDEETKTLKETVARRNAELQAARLMCARTASKLSTVEDELERTLVGQGRTRRAGTPKSIKDGGDTHAFEGVDGDASADAWASALVAELDQFRKEKTSSCTNSDNRRESLNFELMDDFIEMERLAKLSEPAESDHATDTASVNGPSEIATTPTQRQVANLEDALALKEKDLQAAKQMCSDLGAKLVAAEDQLSALQTRNAANEMSLISLQDQLDRLTERQVEVGKGGDDVRANLQKMSGLSIKDILGRVKKSGQTGSASEASSSEGEVAEEHASVSDTESKVSTAHSELAAAVRKIVRIVEALAQAMGNEYAPSVSGRMDSSRRSTGSDGAGEPNVMSGHIVLGMQWKDLRLDSCMQRLVLVGNKFMQGKTDMVDFIVELGMAMDCIMVLKPVECSRRGGDCNGQLLVTDNGTPVMPGSGPKEGSAPHSTKPETSLEEELRRAQEQRAALESHMQAEFNRFAGIDTELEWLKLEKADVERNLEEANEKVEQLKEQLQEAEKLLFDLRRQQGTGQDPKRKEDELIEEELMELSSPNPGLASSMRAADTEMNELHDKVGALEVELHGERRRHQEVVAKLEDLQEQIHRGAANSENSGGSHGRDGDWAVSRPSTSDEEEGKSRKEKEIAAAALAECQRTILALGKQLKVLGTTRELTDGAVRTSTDSATSIQKMTESMEFLRWQTEVADPPSAASVHVIDAHNHTPSALRERKLASNGNCNGFGAHPKSAEEFLDRPVTRPPSPSDFSVMGSASVPGSPGRFSASVLRSVRTRSSMSKSMNGDCDEAALDKPRSVSAFTRFYARSRSGSSGSSG